MGLKESIEHLLEEPKVIHAKGGVDIQTQGKPEINPFFLKAALGYISNRLDAIEKKMKDK